MSTSRYHLSMRMFFSKLSLNIKFYKINKIRLIFQDIFTCSLNVTNLNEIFRLISDNLTNETDKNFEKIKILNLQHKGKDTFILNDTSFWDITFQEFDGQHIKYITNDAFGKSSSTIKSFKVNRLRHSPPQYDVWKLLSRFVNVEEIHVGLNGSDDYYYPYENVVPSQAFVPLNGKQNNLNKMTFDFSNNIMAIQKMAFYNLENLTKLTFFNGSLKKIQDQAFAFSKKSSKKFNIVFSSSYLYDNSFQPKAFDGIRRPVDITFDNLRLHKNVSYLQESVFKSILDYGDSNTITFNETYIDCTDCRNQWLLKERKDQQIKNALCIHNTNITLFDARNREYLSKKCKTSKIIRK